MDDVVTLVFLASSAFFVALSGGLLYRYRQVSKNIVVSSDLGRDLWQALDQRLKRQDERILDLIGRLDVVQLRLVSSTATRPPRDVAFPAIPQLSTKTGEGPPMRASDVVALRPVAPRPESQARLDDTQMAAIRLLSEKARSTIEIKTELAKSREHTARLMKDLFDRGLVIRDDSNKPFVYQLTDAGRRYLSAN